MATGCRSLEALPEANRYEVYTVCQRSWRTALETFSHNASELRWICRHWRTVNAQGSADMAMHDETRAAHRLEALRIFSLFAPLGSLTGSLYDDACLYIKKALSSAKSQAFRYGHYRGELGRQELARTRRSDYAWVFETLKLMSRQQISTCFGQEGKDFVGLCEWTFACRRERRDRHLLTLDEYQGHERTVSGRVAGSPYAYLPRPESAPSELAAVVVTHHPALLAA
jgi:hypothetical protein